jgi:Tfp pilus assembly protein PilO
MSQMTLNIVFVIIAAFGIILVIGIWRYWSAHLNMSEEDEDLERRMAALNQRQAYRRRDDEIVRLLRGDEQRTVDQQRDRERD